MSAVIHFHGPFTFEATLAGTGQEQFAVLAVVDGSSNAVKLIKVSPEECGKLADAAMDARILLAGLQDESGQS